MAEPSDMIVPLLREMRAEINRRFDVTDELLEEVDRRLSSVDKKQDNFRHALIAESLTGKFMTGDFEERILALEKQVRELVAQK